MPNFSQYSVIMKDSNWEAYETDNMTEENPLAGTADIPQWSLVLDQVQIALSFTGVLANGATLITLLKHGHEFKATILLLFRHQSIIDCIICLFGVLLMMRPYHWLPGVPALDIFICQAWHGQQIYWAATFVSLWNLVVIASERYMAVCRPLRYRELTHRRIFMSITGIYLLSILASSGAYFQTKMVNDTCVSGCYFSEETCQYFMPGFAISTFFTFWAFPCTLLVFLYGMVVRELRLRQKEGKFSQSRVIDSASKQLTRTGLSVSGIFFISLVS